MTAKMGGEGAGGSMNISIHDHIHIMEQDRSEKSSCSFVFGRCRGSGWFVRVLGCAGYLALLDPRDCQKSRGGVCSTSF